MRCEAGWAIQHLASIVQYLDNRGQSIVERMVVDDEGDGIVYGAE